MQAVLQSAYGKPADVLCTGEIPIPVPGDNEVLVRVRAASVHPDVWHVVTGRPAVLRIMGSGFSKPTNPVPGTDMAGIVEAVGKSVTRFASGDAVFGETVTGMQWMNGGAFAEYVTVAVDALEAMPANVSFAQAASVPTAGLIVLNNLRNETAIRPGMRVLVNGAGGGVGSLALQIAKAAGAHVTAVDHARKLDLLRMLGADAVIDYTRDDPTRIAERYDLVFDVASNLRLADCKRILAPEGLFVVIGHDHFGGAKGPVLGSLPRMIGLMFRSRFDRHLPKVDFKIAPKRDTMPVLADLLASGRITPVIDKVFPLEDAAEALRYLEVGMACGRIVLEP